MTEREIQSVLFERDFGLGDYRGRDTESETRRDTRGESLERRGFRYYFCGLAFRREIAKLVRVLVRHARSRGSLFLLFYCFRYHETLFLMFECVCWGFSLDSALISNLFLCPLLLVFHM